jgi:putative flippase GtrA
LLAHFIKFSLVGIAGFAIDGGVLTLLLAAGLDPFSGRLCSYLIAATSTWFCNRRFTFRDRRSAARTRQWLSFLAANSVGAIVNYGTFAALVLVEPAVTRHPVLGVAAGSIVGLACNFTLSRAVVFRASEPALPSSGTDR